MYKRQEWDLEGVAGFELDFGALAGAATGVPRYEDLTSFPAIRQDIAVVVADDVPAARRSPCGWSSARPTAR